jgi:hypothetical protein
MKQNPGRSLAAAAIVAAGFVFLAGVLTVGFAKTNPGGKDFIEYWAVEQGLVHFAHPYDAPIILGIEQAAGFSLQRPEFWYSPPPALVLALPLGYLGAKTGLIAWTLLHFACLAASLWLLWKLHGRPDTLLLLFGFLFAPVIICLEAGQISIFFLLAVVLFLTFHETRPFLAGVALLPCVLKPHFFLPFAAALLLWIVHRRAFAVLAGFLASLLASFAIVLSFDRHILSQYRQMMAKEGMLNEYVATLSVTLRFLVDRHAVWLQFVPAGLACAWAIWYFWTRRNEWQWMDHGLLVLLVSAMCAPYGWFFDESVVLPAVLTGVLRARATGRPLWPIALLATAALIEVQQEVSVMSPAYLWTTPAWLAWYVYASGPVEHRKDVASRPAEGQLHNGESDGEGQLNPSRQPTSD